ncbi:dienelactone hydrolase [Tateyamaria omphalii]|uniref:alpha/beta hydrolase family protein n=1 Tax=Tateyamaria omphalii TaxID=299262 RepID=UPI00167C1322|nr:hypothetical protein [Tateyamaria omphalii]GGX71093.1 dienelactone hydrolase [Tateyamaria omphalii]
MLRLILSLALLTCANCYNQNQAGVTIVVLQSDTLRKLQLTVWFPTEQTDTIEFAGNAVFVGSQAVVDAVPAEGPRPLVLLSHGGYRSAKDSGAWLGARLARNGFIAVEVNSPNLNDPEFAMREIRVRAEDLRRALDFLHSDDAWSQRIDSDHTVVVGFALGGTVALRVAGMSLDADRVAAECDPNVEKPHADCDWLGAILANISAEDHRDLETTVRDNRINGVVAIAPEFLQAVVQPTLSGSTEVQIVELGQYPTIPIQGVDANQSFIPASAPMDVFPLCRPTAVQLLKEGGENPEICFAVQFQREFVHGRIFEFIVKFVISRV